MPNNFSRALHCRTLPWLACALLALGCVDIVAQQPMPPPPPAVRSKPPKPEEVAKIRKDLETRFPQLLTGDLNEFYGTLRQMSQTLKNEPPQAAAAFAFQELVIDGIASRGDLEAAAKTLEMMRKYWEIDVEAKRNELVLRAFKSATTDDAKRRVADFVARSVREFVGANKFEEADRLMVAIEQANAGKDPEIAKGVAQSRKENSALAKKYNAVKASAAILKTKPDDPDANLAMGWYYFSKGEYAKGLPMLAKGSDAELKQLAIDDLKRSSDAKLAKSVSERWLARMEKATTAEERGALMFWSACWTHATMRLLPVAERTSLNKLIQGIGYEENVVVLQPPVEEVWLDAVPESKSDLRLPLGRGLAVLGEDNQRYFHDLFEVRVSLLTHPKAKKGGFVEFKLDKKYVAFDGIAVLMADHDPREKPIANPPTFRILGDGKVLWESQPFKTLGTSKAFAVSVANVETLRLEVLAPGDDEKDLWTAWLFPRLTKKPVLPSDVAWLDMLNESKSDLRDPLGRGPVACKARNEKCIDEVFDVPHYLRTHPKPQKDGFVEFKLEKKYATFTCQAALLSDGNLLGKPLDKPVTFRVVGDGKVLWTSQPIVSHGDNEQFEIAIENVETLRLEVLAPGKKEDIWASWLFPKLIRK